MAPRGRQPQWATAALVLVLAAASAPGSARAAPDALPGNGSWHPGPARYGIASNRSVVRMSDGIHLSATVKRPANPATGLPVRRRFPVIVTLTPYAKDEPVFAGVNNTPAS